MHRHCSAQSACSKDLFGKPSKIDVASSDKGAHHALVRIIGLTGTLHVHGLTNATNFQQEAAQDT